MYCIDLWGMYLQILRFPEMKNSQQRVKEERDAKERYPVGA